MKKLFGKVCLLTVLTVILLTVTAAAADLGTGVVTGDSLRMRSAPSTDASTVVYLSKGTEVQILEQLDGWYRAAWNDNTGYLAAEYIDFTPAVVMDLTGKAGVVSGESVNFRAEPSTGAEVLTVLDKDTQLALFELRDGWCLADLGGQVGYISADYIYVDGLPLVDPRGVVTGDTVNVRANASTDADIVGKVSAGTVVDLTSAGDGWYGVVLEDGTAGYISADYLRIYSASAGSGNQDIADKAQEYLGVPYVYGGASAKGFDCSGFTMYICGLFGYDLPHSASAQWNSLGETISSDDLQPGDLVFFNDPSISGGKACSHVGIYIGDGQFIHASSGSSGRYVRISDLSESYYSRYYKGAKRLG